MNEFLTDFSADHTLLWALLIIGVMAAAAIALHLFWSVVLRSVSRIRGALAKGPANESRGRD